MTTDTEIDELSERYSNWGRWGNDDQRGTLNFADANARTAAAGLVSSGGAVSLARRIDVRPGPHNPRPAQHMMIHLPTDQPDRPRGTASDWLGIACHGFATTHIDALCHQSWRGQMYNGVDAITITAWRGSAHGSLEALVDGVFAPAVFLDIPHSRGVPWLMPGEGVSADDLEQVVNRSGIPHQVGDVVVISTGRDARVESRGEHDPIVDGNPGLLPSAVEWIHEWQPALLITDVQCDVMLPHVAPHPMPLHVLCLVALGIHLVDNARLDNLASRCQEQERYRFALALGVIPIPHATGAPVSPVAIF